MLQTRLKGLVDMLIIKRNSWDVEQATAFNAGVKHAANLLKMAFENNLSRTFEQVRRVLLLKRFVCTELVTLTIAHHALEQ